MSIVERNLRTWFYHDITIKPKIIIRDNVISVTMKAHVPFTGDEIGVVVNAAFTEADLMENPFGSDERELITKEMVEILGLVRALWPTCDKSQKYIIDSLHELQTQIAAKYTDDPCNEDGHVLSPTDERMTRLIQMLLRFAHWMTMAKVLSVPITGKVPAESEKEYCRYMFKAREKAEGYVGPTLYDMCKVWPTIAARLRARSFVMPK
jgi:hypothetical protein